MEYVAFKTHLIEMQLKTEQVVCFARLYPMLFFLITVARSFHKTSLLTPLQLCF